MAHKKTHKTDSSRAVTFLLVGIMSIPLLTQIFMDGTGVHSADLVSLFESDIAGMRERALADHDRYRMQRRAYSRAVDRCRDRLRAGEDVVCPDFNDLSTYDLEPEAPEPVEEEEAVHRSAPKTTIRDLSAQERRVLRTYTRAGFCSKAAGVMLYDLCMDMLGEDATHAAPVGIQNDNILLHSKYRSPRPTTINDYLRVLDESINSNPRRAIVRPSGWNQ